MLLVVLLVLIQVLLILLPVLRVLPQSPQAPLPLVLLLYIYYYHQYLCLWNNDLQIADDFKFAMNRLGRFMLVRLILFTLRFLSTRRVSIGMKTTISQVTYFYIS
jgi:hypothetical protein